MVMRPLHLYHNLTSHYPASSSRIDLAEDGLPELDLPSRVVPERSRLRRSRIQ
jgi:hypothetical protein